MLEEKIGKLFEEAGFRLEEKDLKRFAVYLQELKRWNRIHNLTAARNEEEIIKRHFIDSLSLAKCFLDLGIDWQDRFVADVGSGAGFPGVPLKIYLKDIHLYLIESVGKKCSFLEYLKIKLNLDYEVLCERAEEVKRKFYIVVARALGEFEKVVPLLEDISERYVFVMKGKELRKEWTDDLGYEPYRVNIKGLTKSYILWKNLTKLK